MKKMLVLAAVALAAALGLAGISLAQDNQPQAGAPVDCAGCHNQANLSMNVGNEKVSLTVPANTVADSVHARMQCADCHRSIAGFPHEPVKAASVKEYRAALSGSCRSCHLKQFYSSPGSAHTKAQTGDAPVCADCHATHSVQSTNTPQFRLQSVEQCTQCHLNQDMMAKYGVNPQVGQTYLQDFHGKSEALVSLQGPNAVVHQAVCIDCHGVHDIQKPGSDQTAAGNSAQVCVKCHPGATGNFPTAFLAHTEPSLSRSPLVFFSAWFYRIMIPFVVVGLIIHIIFDLMSARRKELK